MEKDYHLFEKDDFLEDAFFLEWVKYATPAATAFFTAYQAGRPPNLAALEQAVATMQAILSLQRIHTPAATKEDVWQQIRQQLDAGTPVVTLKRNSRKRWLAAAVLLPLLMMVTWFLLPERMHKVVSGYGQQVKVVLPDSSVVILNAHSALTYHNWKDGKREVWLEGEALFEVKHTIVPAARNFTVHAGKVEVEVLGTVFNVKQRRQQIEIYLKQGKVKVSAPDHHQTILLQPNEQASFRTAEGQLKKIPAAREVALAWTEHKMQLRQTAVKDIIYTLQDTYGFTIILQDTSIANRTIEGTLSLKNVNNVLFELSAILNVKIEKNNDTLTFKDNGQRGY